MPKTLTENEKEALADLQTLYSGAKILVLFIEQVDEEKVREVFTNPVDDIFETLRRTFAQLKEQQNKEYDWDVLLKELQTKDARFYIQAKSYRHKHRLRKKKRR